MRGSSILSGKLCHPPTGVEEVHARSVLWRGFGAMRRAFQKSRAGIIAVLGFVYIFLPLQALAGEATGDPLSLLSRITVDVPFFTRHVPHPELFNNHNWGAFVDVALSEDWSIATGDFINSYKRATIFAGLAWMPLRAELPHVQARAGVMFGLDVNGGYRPYNDVNPLLGAFSIRFTGDGFENDTFNRLGIAIKVIPPAPDHGSTAINFALSYKLG